jgi:hypothetical protein
VSYGECPMCGGTRADCEVCGAHADPAADRRVLAAISARIQEEHDKLLAEPVDTVGQTDALVLQLALDHWGLPSQLAMLAEESAELAAATMHMLREAHDGPNEEEWIDEVADVWIMIDQMLLTPWAPQIVERRRRKTERLAWRLAASKAEADG